MIPSSHIPPVAEKRRKQELKRQVTVFSMSTSLILVVLGQRITMEVVEIDEGKEVPGQCGH